ncbi:MAG TPA: FtsX-like permease family protein, partial [Longimicrobiales bacterium]|nr:FtsX-like permease family protein [Longimicrobiales bacterium]
LAQVARPLAVDLHPVVLVRTADPESSAAIRRTLADGSGAPPALRSMDDMLADSVAGERFNALLMATFAGVALLLTALGIYGVVSFSVRQRTREIGIRMALGARGGTVARRVVAGGMVPVILGLGLGLAISLALGRFIASLLWGVAPADPRILGGGALFLVLVSLASSYLPAREATGIDPARSLQPE